MNTAESFLPVLLRRYVMTWTHHVERFQMAVWGIEMPESRLMWLIHLLGPMTASELTQHAFMRKFQISRSIAKLRELGFVETTPHPDDLRSEIIHLTERGRACAIEITALSNKWADATESELTPREQTQLLGLVRKLQAGVDRLGSIIDADLAAALPRKTSAKPRGAKARDQKQPARLRLR